MLVLCIPTLFQTFLERLMLACTPFTMLACSDCFQGLLFIDTTNATMSDNYSVLFLFHLKIVCMVIISVGLLIIYLLRLVIVSLLWLVSVEACKQPFRWLMGWAIDINHTLWLSSHTIGHDSSEGIPVNNACQYLNITLVCLFYSRQNHPDTLHKQ